MKENQSVVEMRNYGEIHVRLRELLEQRGMNRNALARAANTRFEVVDKWFRDDVEKIDADVLARFCFVLNFEGGSALCGVAFLSSVSLL